MTPLTQRCLDINTPVVARLPASRILWDNFNRRQLSPLIGDFECDLAASQERHARQCIETRACAPVEPTEATHIVMTPVMVVEFAG